MSYHPGQFRDFVTATLDDHLAWMRSKRIEIRMIAADLYLPSGRCQSGSERSNSMMQTEAERRRDAVIAILDQRAAEGMKSPEAARKMLIEEGIYTLDGKLSSDFCVKGGIADYESMTNLPYRLPDCEEM